MHSFRLRALNRKLRNFHSTSEYRTWQDVRSVLVLYLSDEREQNDDLSAVLSAIRAEGKRLSVCTYVDTRTAAGSSLDHSVVLDRSSVSLTGEPTGIAARRMIEEDSFDVVMDLTLATVVPLQHFMAQADARLRTGLPHPDVERAPYDIVIDLKPRHFAEDDPEAERYSMRAELAGEIIKYLKMIRS